MTEEFKKQISESVDNLLDGIIDKEVNRLFKIAHPELIESERIDTFKAGYILLISERYATRLTERR